MSNGPRGGRPTKLPVTRYRAASRNPCALAPPFIHILQRRPISPRFRMVSVWEIGASEWGSRASSSGELHSRRRGSPGEEGDPVVRLGTGRHLKPDNRSPGTKAVISRMRARSVGAPSRLSRIRPGSSRRVSQGSLPQQTQRQALEPGVIPLDGGPRRPACRLPPLEERSVLESDRMIWPGGMESDCVVSRGVDASLGFERLGDG